MSMNLQRDALGEYGERLRAIMPTRAGKNITPSEARQIIVKVLIPSPPDTVTESDRAALTKYTSLTDADLTPEALSDTDAQIAAMQPQIQARAERDALTTAEVGDLLRTQRSNVQRLVREGKLYVAGKRGTSNLFPAWQFVGRKRVPHLREVLGALPGDMHPLSVQTFMTSANEALDGRTPVAWLATGGRADAVVELADGEAWR